MKVRDGMDARLLIPLILIGLAGCNGTNKLTQSKNRLDVPPMHGPGGVEAVESRVPKTEKDLDDPHRLHITYARWQEYIGNVEAAQLSYQKALKKDSESLEALVGLARIDQHAERTAQAERGFKKALAKHPKSAMAMHALGQFYVSQQRFPEAKRWLSQAVQNEPNNSGYNYDLGVTLAQLGDYQNAIKHMTPAIGEAEALYNVGYLLREKGNEDLSRQYLYAAVQKKPELQQAKFWLANMTTPVEKTGGPGSPMQVKHIPATIEHKQGEPHRQQDILQQVSGESHPLKNYSINP